MGNSTFDAIIDHREVDTETLLKKILTLLLFGEGKWILLSAILFIIIWFIKQSRKINKKELMNVGEKQEEEREEDSWELGISSV